MSLHDDESLWCQRVEKKLDDALEFINGNGKPGAKERLARLELIAAGLVAVVSMIVAAIVAKLFGHGA